MQEERLPHRPMEAVEGPEMPVFLRAEEVAGILRCSRSQVYGWIKRGQIPAVRFGRSVRIPREDFFKWLADIGM
jgi:excisionase family DNA binding protein